MAHIIEDEKDGPRNPPHGPLEEALAELDALIGLDGVKQQVRKTFNSVQLERARKAKGLPDLPVSHHLVFTGNVGTGKTTVARIVGRIYKAIGLLAKGARDRVPQAHFDRGICRAYRAEDAKGHRRGSRRHPVHQ